MMTLLAFDLTVNFQEIGSLVAERDVLPLLKFKWGDENLEQTVHLGYSLFCQ
jgi:hypothetical protein